MSVQTPVQPPAIDETGSAAPVPKPPPARRSRSTPFISGAAALALAGFAITRWAGGGNEIADGLLQANGRMEGDQVTVASKFSGRIHQLFAREGMLVRRGETMAALDDAQADARVSQMDAGVAEAGGGLAQVKARIAQADAAVLATDARIRAASTALEVLRRESAIRILQAEAELEHARAALLRAQGAEKQALRDFDRYKRLTDQGDVEARRAEQAELSLITAQTERTSATSQVALAQQRLSDARLGPDRVRAKEDELRVLEAQLTLDRAAVTQAQAAFTQAQATLRHAEAGRREAFTARSDLTISAPIDGVVTTRMTDLGEVVSAGSPLLTLVDLDHLYLRVFVPEAEIGKVRLGLPAMIYTDAFPGKPFPATVRYISSRAEFTPREVQTVEERVKLVYAVKLYLDANPDHRLTPGLPADAMIRWKDGAPWARPKW